MPCAASPPSTFCQEKVTTSSLAQSSSCAKAAEVASQMVRPCAVGGDPVAVRHAHAGGGAVPGEDHVGRKIDLGEIGQFAVRRAQHRDVLQLELLFDVGDPAFAEAFPGQHGDRARAEQRPQRHLDRAGIGGRHDADAVVGRDLQHFAGEIDGALELRLADLGAVRTAESGVGEGLQVPAGALGAGAGGEVRSDRPHAGLRIGHVSTLSDRRPSLGRGVPLAGIGARADAVKTDLIAESCAARCPPLDARSGRRRRPGRYSWHCGCHGNWRRRCIPTRRAGTRSAPRHVHAEPDVEAGDKDVVPGLGLTGDAVRQNAAGRGVPLATTLAVAV